MSSPFQKSFNRKSPLKDHKKIQRQINILRNKPRKAERKGLSSEGQGGIDYEAIARLEAQLAEAKAAHSNTRTEEGDSQVREDEDAARNSAAEMSSPLHGYREASDMVDSNPPTAHMWTQVFDSFGKLAQNIIDKRSTPEAKAKRLQKRADRRSKRREKNKEKWKADSTKNKAGKTRLERFDDRSKNVTKNLETAKKTVENKKENQALYNTWLAGDGANATEQEKTNKKQSLGLT